MSAPPTTRIRLSDPAELVAAIPHLLGFHPRQSLVLLALHGKRLGLTLRADLVDATQAPLLAEQMLAPLARQEPTGVVLVVIGGEYQTDHGPPHRDLIEVFDETLAAAQVPLVHAIWTAATAAGAPWRCYDDPACAGTLADPAATPLAAAAVAAGVVTFGAREDLVALLADRDPDALSRRSALLQAADGEHPLSARLVARRLALLERLHRQAGSGDVVLDDHSVAEVASALCDHRVRDACLPWCTGPDAVATERLWLALVRATPAPERAEPAALLALVVYLRGDGALAGVALDAAQQACPEHSLSALLRAALDGGLPPDVLRTVAIDAAKALQPSGPKPRRSRRRRRGR